MSEEMKEKLSAYLDDELQVESLSKFSRDLKESSELRSKLNRYTLINEAIKGNYSDCNAASIADSVHQALTNEPTVFAPAMNKKSSPSQWKTYVGGAAIAATVAALTVMNIGLFNQQDGSIEEFPVTVDVQNINPSQFAAGLSQRASTKWSSNESATPEIEAELNQFLIDHSEYTTQSGVPGLLPYATFVVYDKQ